MICVCGHEAEEHISEAGRCTVDGCYCEAFTPDDSEPNLFPDLGPDAAGPGAWD